jgi:hypothetical protein
MEQLGIIEALAYDKHFVQAGYKALMREWQFVMRGDRCLIWDLTIAFMGGESAIGSKT